MTNLVYSSPLVTADVVVAMAGFGGSYLAVKTGGKGDVTATHRLFLTAKANFEGQRQASKRSIVVEEYGVGAWIRESGGVEVKMEEEEDGSRIRVEDLRLEEES